MRTQVAWLAGVSLIALALAHSPAAAVSRFDAAPFATPEGITLEPLGKDQGYDTGKKTAAMLGREQIAFTNEKGLTLYTYDKDPPGKSVCTGDCTAGWKPMVAPSKAKVFGDWSVIKRDDGTLQWAYKSKPLYTFVKDVDPGSVGGNSPARFGGKRIDGAGKAVGGGNRGGGARNAAPDLPLDPSWKPALAYPFAGLALPDGLLVREVPEAAAWALVNFREHTLYTFDGDPKHDKVTDTAWTPVAAPLVADAVGDFSFAVRDDGIKQWTYKGKGLYTYAGDLAVGDTNGAGAGKKFQVAAVARYYMPPEVMLHDTPGQGKVLATAQGMTLYRRDGYIYQSGGGHSLRRGQPVRPAVGRDIGTNARCDAECLKVWHPFKAPADAKPQGFWNVAIRNDGSKQWVYQGYALWTFDGDKKPGDMNGHDSYEFAFSEDPQAKTVLDVGTPQDGAPGLVWEIAIP